MKKYRPSVNVRAGGAENWCTSAVPPDGHSSAVDNSVQTAEVYTPLLSSPPHSTATLHGRQLSPAVVQPDAEHRR